MADIWKDGSLEARVGRWEALWALEDLPRPVWFVPADAMLALPVDYARRQKPVTPLFTSKEVQLSESLKFQRFYERVQRIFFRDDYVPRLQPQLGIGVFASAFGSRVVFPENEYPMTHPVLPAGSPPERVYDLQPPDARAGQLGQVLEYAEYFDRRAGGRCPIAMTDLQGPLDTAYLIWDTCDFMVAMKRNPAEVHHLMRLVTDLIIRFVKELRSRVAWFTPAHFPPVYLPDDKGIAVSEDVLAMLSPRMYAEFSLPYLNELSEEFGGVVVHSCGNIEHQLDTLGRVRNLRGLNFGATETRFEAVWEKLGGKTVLIPHFSAARIVADFKNAEAFARHVMKHRSSNRGLALMVPPEVGDIHAAEMKTALGEKSKGYGGLLKMMLFGAQMRKIIQEVQPRPTRGAFAGRTGR